MNSRATEPSVTVREFGPRSYREVWDAMRAFTDERTSQTRDELWLLEHDAVFTLGQAGRLEHVLSPGTIPVEQSDRGGQVTYHGPGQIVAYLLLNLRRRKLGVRGLVWALEQAVIDLLAEADARAVRRAGAPGVYVDGAKLAALGVRIRRGCCYHGLAVNVDMDLEPFERIDPCGFPGLRVTQLRDLGIEWDHVEVRRRLTDSLLSALERAPLRAAH